LGSALGMDVDVFFKGSEPVNFLSWHSFQIATIFYTTIRNSNPLIIMQSIIIQIYHSSFLDIAS
jgi:hypothetical protein